jgi:iron complex outermembrane recepter protein
LYEEFQANVEVPAGNYGELKGKGALNLPVNDKFAMRFAVIGFERDGFTQNVFTALDPRTYGVAVGFRF